MLVGAWVALAAQAALRIRDDVTAGADELRALRAEAALDDLLNGEGRARLVAARERFAAAEQELDSPLLTPIRMLPVLGRQVRATDGMVTTAAEVTSAALAAATDVEAAIDGAVDGPGRVAAARAVAVIADDAARVLSGADLGPGARLIEPIAEAREELLVHLDDARIALRNAARSSERAAALLAGPRRYLLLAGNNAEMRVGAGMPLSIGLLEVRDGTFDVPGGMSSVGLLPVPPAGLGADPDLTRIWAAFDPTRTWTSATLTPRFDAAAPLLAAMWESIGRPPVDGVLLVDPVGLRAVLDATGPVRTATETIAADTVVEELLHQQYIDDPDLATRRERLGEIAAAAMAALGGDVDVVQLATGLLEAARGRHVLAWSSSTDDAELWQRLGAVGALDDDSLLVSVVNRGANKLDRFLPVAATLELAVDTAATEALLYVRVENDTPPGEPPSVVGDPSSYGGVPGTYAGVVTVHLPGSAEIVDRGPFLPVGPDGPSRVLVLPVQIPPGEIRELEVEFRLPPGGRLVVEPSARVPAIQWQVRRDGARPEPFEDDRRRQLLPVPQ